MKNTNRQKTMRRQWPTERAGIFQKVDTQQPKQK